jgi:archaeosine synthase beta-subunit
MGELPQFPLDDHWISSLRGEKNPVDPKKPYACFIEKELSSSGEVEDVVTIFLTNRECPFHCLMCDLWKNTLDYHLEPGTIPRQISRALDQLPPAKHIKLYNNGNFFDRKAIPEQDYADIAQLVADFETLTVECHPKLINKNCLDFQDVLNPNLQMAIGLETVHPDILPKLNKSMDLNDFENSIEFLNRNNILSRAFILLRPPFLTEMEGVLWAKRSIDYAFKIGVECCVIIPTRAGNGAMDWLQTNNYFSHPAISSLESVLEYGIQLNAGRVFADLWNIELFSSCEKCTQIRKNRLWEMNLRQKIMPSIYCDCE